MTKPIDFCREQFTQKQLDKLLEKAAWLALLPVAIEMEFNINKISMLNFDHTELRELIIKTWREKRSMLSQCQKAYRKVRKENESQRQVVMDFHLKEKGQ